MHAENIAHDACIVQGSVLGLIRAGQAARFLHLDVMLHASGLLRCWPLDSYSMTFMIEVCKANCAKPVMLCMQEQQLESRADERTSSKCCQCCVIM